MPLNTSNGVGMVGVSNWKIEAMRRAVSVDGTLNLIVENDFETNNDAASQTTLSGTVTYNTGVTGGVAKVKTGATPFATAIVYNAGGAALIGNPAGESWYVQTRAWIRNVPTNDSGFACVGLQNTLGLNPQFVTFGWLYNYDPNYLIIQMNKQDGTIIVEDSTVAPDIGTFHDYGLGYDVQNDVMYAMVDGMPILEVAGPFPHLTSQPCFVFSGFISQNLNGQDSELWVDNIAAVVKQAT